MMQTEAAGTGTSLFTPAELAFLKSQQLCRLATANAKGQPHVTPLAFHYDEKTNTFVVGGHGGFAKRKKWRDVQQNPQVALVVDGIISYSPWKVAGIEIRGVAELRSTGGEVLGEGFDADSFVITPKRIISWGIEGEAYGPPNARSV
jgi:PPOX class F420-dependent enzyme/OxyR family protein